MNTKTIRFVGSRKQIDALFNQGKVRFYKQISGNRRMGTYRAEVQDNGHHD